MLNWTGLCGLLMPLIGALSGVVGAHDMKAGTSATILFGFIGLLLGFGMSAVSFKLERQWIQMPSFVYFLMPVAGILVAGAAPNLLLLIVYGHK